MGNRKRYMMVYFQIIFHWDKTKFANVISSILIKRSWVRDDLFMVYFYILHLCILFVCTYPNHILFCLKRSLSYSSLPYCIALYVCLFQQVIGKKHKQFTHYGQGDAQEFLTFLTFLWVDGLHELSCWKKLSKV